MIKKFQGKPYKSALSTFGKVVPEIKDRKKPEAIEAIPMPPLPPDKKAASASPGDEAASDPVTTPRSASQTSSKRSVLVKRTWAADTFMTPSCNALQEVSRGQTTGKGQAWT